MRKIRTALLYGFLLWLGPFVLSVLIGSLRNSNRPLFESIMPVALAAGTVWLSNRYHRKRPQASLREWLGVGLLWLLMSLLLDWPMFAAGPMQMTLAQYLADIGATYVMIPIITVGAGYLTGKPGQR